MKVSDFLTGIGHRSVFLDYDPEKGIPAGRSWEKELYSNLRHCQALVVLCSRNFIASAWCFAEITHARAMGKYIIPLQIDDGALHHLLIGVQAIDATQDEDEAFSRLQRSLDLAGVNKIAWEIGKPPYPGLLAFQEEEAPVFFGREAEKEDLLKLLRQFRSFGGSKILMVIGASGSGKSSLIRAGIIPLLRNDKKSWIIIGPFRPLKLPFLELGMAISAVYHDLNETKNGNDIANSLIHDSGDSGNEGKVLIGYLKEIIDLSKQSNATILLFIDQLEELLTDADKNRSDESSGQLFLTYLNRVSASFDDKLLVIGTLRSDFLGSFTESKFLKDIAFEDFIVNPISQEGLKASITEPAKVAGLELEEGLAESIVNDTETSDALPLLAFTLRELWEQFGKDNLLTIDEYKNRLGGMEGSVAKVAEAVLFSHIRLTKRGEIEKQINNEPVAILDPDDEQQLKLAFMAMVRIDNEGRYTKRLADIDELPQQINNLLQSFISARLLISSGDRNNIRIEVAHEAIFRTWARLVKWLQDDKNFLLWRKRLSLLLEDWATNKGELLRGPALAEALGWLNQHKAKKYNLTPNEVVFITTSQKKAEKERSKRRLTVRILYAVSLLVMIVIAFLYYENYKANIDIQNQLARTYWNNAKDARSGNNLLPALHYTSEAITITKDGDLKENLFLDTRDLLNESWMKEAVVVHQGINGALLHPDKMHILTWGDDGTVRLWNVTTGKESFPSLKHSGKVYHAEFSKNGNIILSSSTDGSARLWNTRTGDLLFTMKHGNRLRGAVFSHNEKWILSWDTDEASVARLWETSSGKELKDASMKHNGGIRYAAFSNDDQLIFTWGRNDSVMIWRTGMGAITAVVSKHDSKIPPEFSHDGKQILISDRSGNPVTGTKSDSLLVYDSTYVVNRITSEEKIKVTLKLGTAATWSTETGQQTGTIIRHHDVKGARFNRMGTRILTWGDDGIGRLWASSTGKQIGSDMKQEDMITGAVFSADEKYILSWGFDRTARLWDAETCEQIAVMRHDDILEGAIFNPGQERILSWGDDGAARIWEKGTAKQMGLNLQHDGDVEIASYSEDGKNILTWCKDGVVCLWKSENKGDSEKEIMLIQRIVNNVALSKNGRTLLAWGFNDTVFAWDLNTGKKLFTLNHKNWIGGVKFSANEKRILTWSGDSTIGIWDGPTGNQLLLIRNDTIVRTASFCENERTIVTWSANGDIKFWDDHSGEQLGRTINLGENSNAVFDLAAKRILTASENGVIRLWELPSGNPLGDSMKHEKFIEGMQMLRSDAKFSDDENYVLSWGFDNSARLWYTSTSKSAGPTMLHAGDVEGAYFSPDGKQILTCSQDRTARIWKTGTNEQIGPSMVHDEPLVGGTFSADGKRILTWDFSHSVNLWESGTGKRINFFDQNNFNSAIFGRNKNQIIAWDDDAIHLIKTETDLDISPELFKLQTKVITGIVMNTDANVINCIAPAEWYQLKDEYLKKASEHYKVCKYPQHNLWKRFFPKEAKEIRP